METKSNHLNNACPECIKFHGKSSVYKDYENYVSKQ